MRISTDWLNDFAASGLPASELAERLTLCGLAVEGIEGQGAETVLELDITANRPDCLSHYGVAREVAALRRKPLLPLEASQPRLQESGAAAESLVKITIDAPAGCARYCARVLEKVSVGASPQHVVDRLGLMGSRSINNVADITNYVLFETGQPTHAFDLDKLRGGAIHVRYARQGEKLVTLDEVERTLDASDLVIADAEGPVALAGVMGGLESAITEQTTRVLIESAWFEPTGVRRTAKRHGLHTDASHRFERGADFNAAPLAANRIAGLLQEFPAGKAPELRCGLIDVRGDVPGQPEITLRAQTVERLLGQAVPPDQIELILTVLGFQITSLQGDSGGGASWRVAAPSWRPDVRLEVDLVEEIARQYGYERFPSRLPSWSGAVEIPAELILQQRLGARLRARGFTEAVALSFVDAGECARFAGDVQAVHIRNPLSEEAAALRTSALPSMLHLLHNNLNRGVENPRLYEFGKIYELRDGAPNERRVLSLGAAGRAAGDSWADEKRAYDFYDLKAEVNATLESFAIGGVRLLPCGEDGFHPGRSAVIEDQASGARLARFGQLHPELAQEWKFKQPVWIAEIWLDGLYDRGGRTVQYQPPSRFPASERDLSFLLPDAVRWEQLEQAIAALQIGIVSGVQPLEVFRGASLPEGYYSLLFRVRLQMNERTLREEEIQEAMQRITEAVSGQGGQQRK